MGEGYYLLARLAAAGRAVLPGVGHSLLPAFELSPGGGLVLVVLVLPRAGINYAFDYAVVAAKY